MGCEVEVEGGEDATPGKSRGRLEPTRHIHHTCTWKGAGQEPRRASSFWEMSSLNCERSAVFLAGLCWAWCHVAMH
jgi:hypothetical protein